MSIALHHGARWLFQGDSITDAARDRAYDISMGRGYAMMTAGQAMLRFPDRRLTFLNRGISGNRVRDLVARWTEDAIALQPDFLSILIGINDTWRRYDRDDPTSAEDFERDYRLILGRVRRETRARIILLEPFLLPVAGREAWREDLDPKRAAVRRLAAEFADVFIPLDDLFRQRWSAPSPAYWAEDGVHPTPAGHALIAGTLQDLFV